MSCLIATMSYFGISCLLLGIEALHALICHFLLFPSMTEYRIFGSCLLNEFLELEGPRMKQTHREKRASRITGDFKDVPSKLREK
jgi:hypothetical protein